MTRPRTLAEVTTVIERRSAWNEDGCLIWRGPLNRHGYGVVGFESASQLVHRVFYAGKVGPIPDGMHLDHTCHNEAMCPGGPTCPHRACITPGHLEPVTNRENTRRSPRVQRAHCIHGHERTPENVYVHRGKRYCRECNREASAQSKIRRAMRAANVRLDGAA